MKLAITAQGPTLTSLVDPRFGRAAYIIIVDSENMTHEALDNSQNAQSFKGAGIQAATMIHDKGAKVLLTGYCGPKAFQTLQAGGIEVFSDISGTVTEAVETYRAGRLKHIKTPNAEAHW